MKGLEKFIFCNLRELETTGFVFEIEGAGIADQQDLFDVFGNGLNAPNCYFGENWNAFKDCLLGLEWIDDKDIYIIHRSLPNLPDDELKIYLDIIRTCITEWASTKTCLLAEQFDDFVPHSLKAVFSCEQKPKVQKLLA